MSGSDLVGNRAGPFVLVRGDVRRLGGVGDVMWVVGSGLALVKGVLEVVRRRSGRSWVTDRRARRTCLGQPPRRF